jgi:uncharacterized coiled-coil protein SlyX
MFSENMFSDPAPQKLLKMGPKLFTDGHQRLVYLLREECGRLFSFNKSLKDRIASLERQNRSQNEAIADLRSIVHAKSEKIVSMAADLRDSQEALQEMDAMLSETRNKRLSRLGQRNMETLDLGEHAI